MSASQPRILTRRSLLGLGLGAAAVGVDFALGGEASAVNLSGVTGVVNTSSLNVHSYPSVSHRVVGTLKRGDTVTCTATASQWFKLRHGSLTGWANSQYITLTPAVSIQTIERGPTTTARVCLTFDAGADRGNAPGILDTLKTKNVFATFGMTGHWANENPDLVTRIAREGHSFINHTLTHRSWTGFSDPNVVRTPAERMAELFATEQYIFAASGRHGRPFFRPPYGDYDSGVLNDVSAAGFAYNVMWTVDSLGWNGLATDDIVYRCLTNRGKGYIYLMHVGAASDDAFALPRIIDGLRSHGYRFGTIERLLGVGVSAADVQSDASTPTPTKLASRPAKTTTTPTSTPKLATATPSPTSTIAPEQPTASPTDTPTETPTEPAVASPVA
jgi:peptidoglycan/xylan/chitin deacetylase (PgdA/CDA1 family)